MGVALAICLLMMVGYWIMDKASNHSAITEANRLEPLPPFPYPMQSRCRLRKIRLEKNLLQPMSSTHRDLKPTKDLSYRESERDCAPSLKNIKAEFSSAPRKSAEGAGTSAEAGASAGQIAAGVGIAEVASVGGWSDWRCSWNECGSPPQLIICRFFSGFRKVARILRQHQGLRVC